MSRESRIKDYVEMLELGDELYECDKRKVIRKTTTVFRSNNTKDIITSVVKEEIEFI